MAAFGVSPLHTEFIQRRAKKWNLLAMFRLWDDLGTIDKTGCCCVVCDGDV